VTRHKRISARQRHQPESAYIMVGAAQRQTAAAAAPVPAKASVISEERSGRWQ